MNRASAAIRALRSQRWTDIRDVGAAQLALLRAQAQRWLKPVGQLVEVTENSAAPNATVDAAKMGTCDRVTSAVDRAARYGVFQPKCLTRAMAISNMLDASGVHGHRIRVGVRRIGDSFAAHAWVELGDVVLGDEVNHTRAFLPLTSVSRKGSRPTSAL